MKRFHQILLAVAIVVVLSISGAAWGTLGQPPTNAPVPSIGPRASPALINTGLGWDGLSFSAVCATCVPADAQIASGSGYVVEFVNGTEETWTTGGTVVGTKTLDSLFGAGTDPVTDPQVHYDPNALRWFASADDSHAREIFYGASQTSDPTGAWNVDHFSLVGFDTPKQSLLGVNSVDVVLTTNVFNRFTSAFLGAEVFVVNKTQLLAGSTPSNWTSGPTVSEEALVPAETTTTSNVMYLVSDHTGNTTLSLYQILGTPPTTPSLTLLNTFSTSYTTPANATQSGSADLVGVEDGRIESATWRGGTLWAAAADGCHAGTNSTLLSCLHLWEISTSGPSSLVQDFVWSTGGGTYDFFPAIATDPAGDLTVVFGESSSSMDPSVLVTQQTLTDPPATLETPTLLKIGTGPDQPHSLCTGNVCPFGAYFGAAYEPLSGSRVWVVGEYTSSSWATTYWNTWIGSTTTTETEPVNFSASGLPAGSAWSVTLSGDTVASSASSIVFSEPVGTYTFTVTTPITGGSGIQYVGSPSSGSLTVGSHALSEPIVYTKQYRLTTTVSPAAAGTVLPTSNWVNATAPVSLGALASAGYVFQAWNGTGAGSYNGTADPLNLTIQGPVTEQAVFAPHPTSRVSFNASGLPFGTNWSVTLNGIGESSAATSIDFNVTSGHFSYVVMSPISGANGTRYVAGPTVGSFSQNNSNSSIPITFAAQYELTTYGSPVGWGTVSPATEWLAAGSFVELSALATTGRAFNDWTGSGVGHYSGLSDPALITLNGPVAETAHFQALPVPTFGVRFTESGLPSSVNWTLSLNGAVQNLGSADLNVTETNGTYSFTVGVVGPGTAGVQFIATPSDGSLTINGANVTEPIHFVTQYELTTGASPNGSGTAYPSGQWYDAGTQVTLFADGASGYTFVSWSGTGPGSYSGATDTVAITALGPVQEIAHFAGQDPVTFHVIPVGSGSILFDGSVYSNGQSLLTSSGTYPLSAEPAAGWELVNWSGVGSVALTSGNATIEGPSVINVTFVPALELTVVTAPAGCGSLAIAGNVYGNGGAIPLAQGLYTFAALPCANFTLTSIVATGGVIMAAGRLSVMGNGSLIATFSADALTQPITSSPGTEGMIPLWIPVLIALAAAAALLILLFATRRRKSPPAPPAGEAPAPDVAASAPTAIDPVVVPVADPRPPWSEEPPGGDPSTVTFPV